MGFKKKARKDEMKMAVNEAVSVDNNFAEVET